MEEHIKSFIISFRAKLEKHLEENDPTFLCCDPSNPGSKFPNNACKSTSYLLGQILKERFGLTGIEYVFGYEKGNTHGWLEIEGYIVDLTADQFSGEYEKVLIVETPLSSFHSTFEHQKRFPHKLGENSILMSFKDEFVF